MKTFKLTEEEHEKVVELYKTAQNTPVVLLFGKTDLSKEAWDAVRRYMDYLAHKHGYDPETGQISMDSPEFEAEEKDWSKVSKPAEPRGFIP